MKLKSLLKESKVWERKFGEPLPTLEDTTKAYKLKQEDLNEREAKSSHKLIEDIADILGKSPEDVAEFVNKQARFTGHKNPTKFAKKMQGSIRAAGRNRYSQFRGAIEGDKRELKKILSIMYR